jgi:hypothetical protein
MTEDQPRNGAGQFTSAEPLTGREAELAAHGYYPKQDPAPDQPEAIGSDDESLRALASESAPTDLSFEAALLNPEIMDEALNSRLSGHDPAEALTIEQAAAEYQEAKSEIASYSESAALDQIAAEIDQARLKAVKDSPELADLYDMDKERLAKVDAAEQAKDQPVQAEPAEAVEPKPSAEAKVDGLDPEVERALKHPQVRQAIEQEYSRAYAVAQSYDAALATANQFAQATLAEQLPELKQLPISQWEAALTVLAQHAPARVQGALGALQRVVEASQAQSQWNAQKAEHQKQQFATWAKAQDDQFEALIKNDNFDRREVSTAIIEYAREMGIDHETLLHGMQTNPAMRHAGFQRMMVDAARYRQLTKNPPRPTKSLPPVNKPGIAGGAKEASNSSQIAALTKQLASATGDKAVELATKLYQLESKGRR